jgi:glycerate 2-kinase
MSTTDRELLQSLYRTAIEAADPGRALLRALNESAPAPGRIWIIALGKAAEPLAESAVDWLQTRGLEPAGGIIVGLDAGPAPHPALAALAGEHPVPGERSLAAADAVENVVRQVVPTDEVWVLLSGGTSSLIASPVRGISMDDLQATYRLLLGSGLDIADMNRIRKRISRWAGGRLAAVLAHARVRLFVLSDVIGDDIASIGSGPCSPDPSTAVHIRAFLDEAGLLSRVPPAIVDLLDRTERGMVPETPKPGDHVFRDVTAVVIGSNRVALQAAAAAAEEVGLSVRLRRRPIRGDAAAMGARIARRIRNDMLASAAAEDAGDEPEAWCYLCGGETTVTLDEDSGKGGRCQEMALAAAQILAEYEGTVTLLAAGTDGRDGPTDAAGAIVDGATWAAIVSQGLDPAAHLAEHDAWPALDAANALVRSGPTRTNVMDVVIAIAHPKTKGST